MAKKKQSGDTASTAGELRQLIAKKGLKWTVDPRLRDNDPLPHYAHGGAEPHDDAPEIEPVQDVKQQLRGHPPINPFLRARWIELKLLSAKERGFTPGSPPTLPTPAKEKKK